jgi:hypothetical protein
MVAVVICRATAMHAVIHDIRIGEAVGSIVAMTESHDRWGRDKAKGGENGEHHRHSKAKPGTECPHYEFKLSV